MEKRYPKKTHNGVFLDVQRLYSVLFASGTEKFSLEQVTKNLKLSETKKKAQQHGVINEDYIEYNLKDVRTTYLAFLEVEKAIKNIGLRLLRYEKIFSGASIGKHLFKEMNILPFKEMNPDYPVSGFGRIMQTFYAGRVECKLRHENVFVKF